MANFFEPPRYIAVEGPIRVGKSTLARIIAEKSARATDPGTGEQPVSGRLLRG